MGRTACHRVGFVAIVMGLVLAACGDDAATTTIPANTTAVTTAVTTAPPSTDPVVPTSPPTSAPATTATEALVPTIPIVTIGTIAPTLTIVGPWLTVADAVIFEPDGIGFAAFGDDPESVMDSAVDRWGTPVEDSGVRSSNADFCPGTAYRKVTWTSVGMAEVGTMWIPVADARWFLLFTDDDPWSSAGGDLVFSGYGYTSILETKLTAGPPTSIDVGVTVAQLRSMWPGVGVFASEFDGAEMFQYSPGGYNSGVVLMGRLTGLTDADTITDVYGGNTCYNDAPGLD